MLQEVWKCILRIWTKYNSNAVVFEKAAETALILVNSFINFDGVTTSQTLPVSAQQMAAEHRAQ